MAWIKVDRKVDLLALTSFLLSLIAITHQFFEYLRGAIVDEYPPTLVTLVRYNYGTVENPTYGLNLAGPMSFTNRGDIGYSEVVTSERVTFMGPSKRVITMRAYNFFDSFDPPPNNPDGPLQFTNSKAAGPTVVPARDAITHGTWFVPFNSECRASILTCYQGSNFVPFDQDLFSFLSSNKQIEFEFSADLLSAGKTLSVKCHILTSEFDLEAFKRRGWATFDCYK